MFLRLLSILLLIGLIQAQPSYQERIIYYSEEDNVCRYGERSDRINLIININDQVKRKRVINGGTMCQSWVFRYANAIMPADTIYFLEEDTSIRFPQ